MDRKLTFNFLFLLVPLLFGILGSAGRSLDTFAHTTLGGVCAAYVLRARVLCGKWVLACLCACVHILQRSLRRQMTETVGCKRGGEIISSQKERERGDFCPEYFFFQKGSIFWQPSVWKCSGSEHRHSSIQVLCSASNTELAGNGDNASQSVAAVSCDAQSLA